MNNNNIEMLDILNILSFVISIMNYQENLTQSDKQDLLGEVNKATDTAIKLIRKHLDEQDDKLNFIMDKLEVITHEKN